MTAGRKNQAAFDLGVKFARLDSIFGGAMFYRLLLVSTIFWLCACDRQPSTVTGGAVPLVAPSGQGFRIDMSGRSVPLFETIGLLRDDEVQDVTIGPDGLQGYAFDGVEQEAVRLILQTDSAPKAKLLLAVYGPRGNEGLWGEVLVSQLGEGMVQLDLTLTSGGRHFVLFQTSATNQIDGTLALICPGCSEASCAQAPICNLHCSAGFDHDESGCAECQCRGGSCATSGCEGDGECLFACGRGFCAQGATCQDGVCVEAACAESCGAGSACIDGRCAPARFRCFSPAEACESQCEDVDRFVCAKVDGVPKSFRSACHASCNGASDVVDGRCMRCGDDAPCDSGLVCVDGECRSEECARCLAPSNRAEQVCGRDGQTYVSACRAECAGTTVWYEGPCRTQCEVNADCPFGASCRPTPDRFIPGNMEACRSEDSETSCSRECVSGRMCSLRDPICPTIMSNMSNDELRPEAAICYPTDETTRAGICLRRCDLTANSCGMDLCARVEVPASNNAEGEFGICLRACNEDVDCRGGARCLPDVNGQLVCQTCQCGALPRRPVCQGENEYRNICEAVCQGVVIDALVLKQDREICDGKDNDCDGRIDEGLTRRCGSNVGECRMGEQTCENGEWLECRHEVRPVDEVCDQLDNDCDGRTDERDGDDGALDGSVCVEDPPSCDECDNTWAPVCGDDPSLIYTNRCEATCAGERMDAQIRSLDSCIGRRLPRVCMNDDQCFQAGPENRYCISARVEDLPDITLTSGAACLAGRGLCGCIDGLCGYRQTDESERCRRGLVRPDALP